jgi:hypothetical protein
MGWRYDAFGVLRPLDNWFVSVTGPRLCENEYVYLWQLYRNGFLSLGDFKLWHDHSFNGVLPEHLWSDLVSQDLASVLDTRLFSDNQKKVMKPEGSVVYDSAGGHSVSDRGVPRCVMDNARPGGVVLCYSGGGKSHFVKEVGSDTVIDGDSLVHFPGGWQRSRKLRKSVMSQYQHNVANAALCGKTVLVNVNDDKVVDYWLRAGIVVGFVPVSPSLLKQRARSGALRSDQVGRVRHLTECEGSWRRAGICTYSTLGDAVDAAARCVRGGPVAQLPTLLRLLKEGRYCAESHSWLAKRIFPTTSRMLEEREQVSVGLSLAYAQDQLQQGFLTYDQLCTLLQRLVGFGGQMCSNVVQWCCGLDGGWGEFLRLDALFGLLNGDIASYIKICKHIHTLIRNADSVAWFDGIFSVDHYLYLQLLTGRFRFGHLDFAEELASRATPATPINDNAYGCEPGTFEGLVENVADYLASLYADGCMAQADKTLDDFCADFLSWSTSGSAPSKGLAVVAGDGSVFPTSGGSKVAQLNVMGPRGILECFGIRPNCIGQPTHKYEAGKLRMLLPGPLRHWIMESIALWGGEGHVLRSIDNITLEQNSFVEFSQMTMRMTSSMGGFVRACSDFADYNILHTFKRMQMLWFKQAQAIAGKLALPPCTDITDAKTMTDFMQLACRWCANALDKVEARLPTGQFVELVRGLWSGWRSTMYINVTYNFAYTTAQRLMFIRRYGRDPLSRYSVLGDDMEGDSPSLWTALKFVSLIDELGLDAQADKQMVSLRRAEYLRLMYREGPSISGSYCRAIAGLTSGDTQTSPRYAGIKSVQNVSDGINRCIRRGGHEARFERMRSIAVKFWSVVEHNGQKFRPKASVLRSPTWLGGMGVCRCDGRDVVFAANATPGAVGTKVRQQGAALSKLMCSLGYGKIASWYDGPLPLSSDVDASILTSILPAQLRSKLVALERLKTVEYYRQKSRIVKPVLLPELSIRFNDIIDRGLNLDAASLVAEAKPDKWWSGMVRDVLGPLASHPKSERLLGKSAEQKMINVVTHTTNRVHDARTKFLGLDPLTRLNTVTGELKLPSPLAGKISPLLRHIVACCHSAYILWLKQQSFSKPAEWHRSMVNALYTFEMCFLARQNSLVELWRV